jgi:hypothetical protein
MYFFWLFDWNQTLVSVLGRFQPNYTFCRIDAEELYLQDAQIRFSIPLDRIKYWRTLSWASYGAKVLSNLEIVLDAPLEVRPGLAFGPRLFLMPMDVFRFDTSHDETRTMEQVLDHFKQGAALTINPNPYLRNTKHNKRQTPPPGGWDPVQPPYLYNKNPTTLSNCLMIVVMWLIFCLIFIPILGLLANALLRAQ